MNYTIERRNKIVIFSIKEKNLNSEVSPKLKAELLIICRPDIDALLLDVSKVEAIDSSGLGSLLLAHRQLHEHEVPVYLIGATGMVYSLISISQIEPLFKFADSVDDAIEEIEADSN